MFFFHFFLVLFSEMGATHVSHRTVEQAKELFENYNRDTAYLRASLAASECHCCTHSSSMMKAV